MGLERVNGHRRSERGHLIADEADVGTAVYEYSVDRRKVIHDEPNRGDVISAQQPGLRLGPISGIEPETDSVAELHRTRGRSFRTPKYLGRGTSISESGGNVPEDRGRGHETGAHDASLLKQGFRSLRTLSAQAWTGVRSQSQVAKIARLTVISATEPIADLVFDVGMHKGEDSSFYLAKGYRVVGFEANPELAASCQRRFASEIFEGRMTIIEGAISDSAAATVRFYKHPNTVWGTTETAWAERNLVVAASDPIDVPTVDFAAVLRETGMPHFMKIDVEGADRLCLETLLSLEQRPNFVSIESEQENWNELEAEFSLLEALGYDRFAVVQQATVPGTRLETARLGGELLPYEFEPDASGPFGPEISPWLSKQEALRRYRRVFLSYRLLGPKSWIRRTKVGRGLRGQAAKYTGRPLPGWFDTHATCSSTIGR